MFKVEIRKNGILTNSAEFETQAKADAWVLQEQFAGSFGPINSYDLQITDITAEALQKQTNKEALAYLASTDWYIIRELDSGELCPDNIKTARAQARARIV